MPYYGLPAHDTGVRGNLTGFAVAAPYWFPTDELETGDNPPCHARRPPVGEWSPVELTDVMAAWIGLELLRKRRKRDRRLERLEEKPARPTPERAPRTHRYYRREWLQLGNCAACRCPVLPWTYDQEGGGPAWPRGRLWHDRCYRVAQAVRRRPDLFADVAV